MELFHAGHVKLLSEKTNASFPQQSVLECLEYVRKALPKPEKVLRIWLPFSSDFLGCFPLLSVLQSHWPFCSFSRTNCSSQKALDLVFFLSSIFLPVIYTVPFFFFPFSGAGFSSDVTNSECLFWTSRLKWNQDTSPTVVFFVIVICQCYCLFNLPHTSTHTHILEASFCLYHFPVPRIRLAI